MAAAWSYLWVTISAVIAVLMAVARRLLRGPRVPGWTWTVELRRAFLAGIIDAAMDRGNTDRWSEVNLGAPMPRSLRGSVHVDPGSSGGIPGEWLRLETSSTGRAQLLYLHGGGYVMGHPQMERSFIARLAARAGSDAFSADYRLAPRHQFPAALEDAQRAYGGMLEAGCDPDQIFLIGDSAGGGLAVALLVRLRDEGRPLPAGAVLFSPWVDLANTASTIVTNAETDYLPPMAGRPAIEYLGDTDPREPTASPLYADLTGLPPMFVLAGSVEMILEDATRLTERAKEHGVDAEIHIEPDMYHVWPVVLPRHPASARAVEMAADWILARMTDGDSRSGGTDADAERLQQPPSG